MPPTIFATGLSGYIGGDVLSHLTTTHPTYRIRALVRSLEQQATTKIRAQFPNVELVEGTLDSLSVLQSEARTADLVLQLADADHRPGTLALLHGLGERNHHHHYHHHHRADHGGDSGNSGTYIHLSGAANLIDSTLRPGLATPLIVGDDGDDAAYIASLPRERIHAALDQDLVAEGERLGVRTAIVSPGMVHGRGRGVKKIGYALYFDAVLAGRGDGRRAAFVVNEGENVQSAVHVADVASAIELLVEAALSTTASPSSGSVPVPAPPPPSSSSSPAVGWGREGYYFVEAEELPFSYQAGVVARLFSEAGLIATSEVDHLTAEEVAKFHQYAVIVFGTSIRARARKLRALGWAPVGPTREVTLKEEIEDFVAARKGLVCVT